MLGGGALLLWWAIANGGGLGNILSEAPKLQQGSTPFWTLFPAALTANVGYWATLSLNIPDFTRYAQSQRSQALGQALGLPATMTAFAFLGVAVTSATIVIFGEAIWDPVVLIARIGSPMVVILGALVVLAAQITTNMAANVVSPANDFSSLAPKRISYVTGGLITAALGIVMMPWKLYADASAYIFTWLIGYSSLMGAVGGILIADYWILRKRELSLPDLFKVNGRYSYGGGTNPQGDHRARRRDPAGGSRFHPRRDDAGRHRPESEPVRSPLHLRVVRHLCPECRDLLAADGTPRAAVIRCRPSRQTISNSARVQGCTESRLPFWFTGICSRPLVRLSVSSATTSVKRSTNATSTVNQIGFSTVLFGS